MKATTPLTLKTFLLLAASIMIVVACQERPANKPYAEPEVTTGGPLTAATPCECEDSWFPHTQTPPPAEGTGSPFDTSSTTICIFHQWSWQKFLYLTKPQSNGFPLWLNQLAFVDEKMQPVQPQLGIGLVLSSTGQAGGGGVLKTDPDFNPSVGTAQTVYYSIQANDVLINAGKSYAQQIASGSLAPNNSQTFPVNSLEVKGAWVSSDAIPSSEIANYYTVDAAVIQNNGSYAKENVALLGLHVVGRVINHPEFIWATFEHKSMGPDFDWDTGVMSASASSNELVFGTGSTNTLDGIQQASGSTAPKTADQAYTLFDLGVPRAQGNQFIATSQQNEPTSNYDEVVSINACVAGKLTDVWNNYFYKGSVWVNMDGLTTQQQAQLLIDAGKDLYLADPGKPLRGCVGLSNLSMETYQQTFASSISQTSDLTYNSNCFACHSAESFASGNPKSPLYLSHIFDGYLSAQEGKSLVEIRRLKTEQHDQFRKALGMN